MTAIRYALIFALVFLPASPFATTFPVTKTADTNDGDLRSQTARCAKRSTRPTRIPEPTTCPFRRASIC